MRSTDVQKPNVNVIFMIYRLETDPEKPREFRLALVAVEGASHASLQNAILYREPPPAADFCAQISRSLVRAVSLADLIKAGAERSGVRDSDSA